MTIVRAFSFQCCFQCGQRPVKITWFLPVLIKWRQHWGEELKTKIEAQFSGKETSNTQHEDVFKTRSGKGMQTIQGMSISYLAHSNTRALILINAFMMLARDKPNSMRHKHLMQSISVINTTVFWYIISSFKMSLWQKYIHFHNKDSSYFLNLLLAMFWHFSLLPTHRFADAIILVTFSLFWGNLCFRTL